MTPTTNFAQARTATAQAAVDLFQDGPQKRSVNAAWDAVGVGEPHQGYLDYVDCTSIFGWAWNSTMPDSPVSVEVYAAKGAGPISERILIAVVPANQYRQDLFDAGIGNGQHGFSFNLPPNVRDTDLHTISVKIHKAPVWLVHSPRSIICGQQYAGVLEIATCGTVAGWAWDITTPNTPIGVDIYDGNKLLSTVTANQFRQDLATRSIGNGHHGFTYSPPAEPPSNGGPRSRSIAVRFRGTVIDLANSPRQFSCR
jgi:hypothetical protein